MVPSAHHQVAGLLALERFSPPCRFVCARQDVVRAAECTHVNINKANFCTSCLAKTLRCDLQSTIPGWRHPRSNSQVGRSQMHSSLELARPDLTAEHPPW